MRVNPQVVIGVDLGGTKIEAVVIEREANGTKTMRELARVRVSTDRHLGYEVVLARTADLVFRVAREAGVDVARTPMGVGMPGSVTRRDGLVKNSNTLCLNGRPFRDDLSRALGLPGEGHAGASRSEAQLSGALPAAIVFENDATCFALAEATLGAAASHREGLVFGVILGTGVGGGIVVRGVPWGGTQGIAGEWGHHGVWAGRPDARVCYCGQRGCLEQYASGPAVEGDYAERSGLHLSLAGIATAAASDAHAAAAIESLVDAFGRGLANVIDVLDPSAIVIGGGVSNLDVLYGPGIDRVRRYVFNDELLTPILKNALGDSAGVIGAAMLAAPV